MCCVYCHMCQYLTDIAMNPRFCLPLLYIIAVDAGASRGFNLSSAQTYVAGYENDSILLPVSYYMDVQPSWLQIRWELLRKPKEVQLIIYTISYEGTGQKTFKQFPPDGYEKRIWVIPENGSLVIKHLKMEDSGVYRVSLLDTLNTESVDINVTVQYRQTQGLQNVTMEEKPSVGGQCICTFNNSDIDVPTSAWIIFSSRVSCILIIILIFLAIHTREKRIERRRMLSHLRTFR